MHDRTIAFIPVRGGSKSIPLKNIKDLHGKPLVVWVVEAALASEKIDDVIISTDSDIISNKIVEYFNLNPNANVNKLQIYRRLDENATDEATTESAMLEYANQYDFSKIVLIQATSPLIETQHINQGIIEYEEKKLDSLISLVRQKRFIWNEDEARCLVEPNNYRIDERPRRQDQRGFLVENGAMYITSRKQLISTGQRISGNIGFIEMPEESYIELDEPVDWIILESILKQRQRSSNYELSSKAKKIKLFAMDCDGVLTDGGMYYNSNGDELKKFNTRDGMGISMLHDKGIITAIITGEDIPIVRKRAQKLKINELYMGVRDKVAVMNEICEKYQLDLDEVAYIGDDINDLELLKQVGLSFTVADGNRLLKEVVDYQTTLSGGQGAVREAIELLLE